MVRREGDALCGITLYSTLKTASLLTSLDYFLFFFGILRDSSPPASSPSDTFKKPKVSE